MADTGEPVRIAEAVWPDDRVVVAELFGEYVAGLGVDLAFQDIAGELAGLPGKYARPGGVALIARRGREPVGIGAYRKIEPGLCEMKRLYVRPAGRGRGLGRDIAEELIDDARAHGYRTMLLDTLAAMRDAQALYLSLGFRPVEPYYDNPLPGTVYMALEL